ncbi:hypothetical protein WJX77_001117 [Trebouxia sp. C0004]
MPAGITPNARADRDAVGGLADLLAHEIAINNFGIMDMIRTRHPQLWQSRMWFSKRLSDMPDNLPSRFQELHQCLTKIAVAWWQNLAINTLKYGLGYVEGLPNVAKVMQTRAYQNFATAVRVVECDSMEKLHCMDAVPHLTRWKLEHVQAVGTRVPAALAAMTAEIQEPTSKRQRVEATAAQTQKQAKIDAMKVQNRQGELDLKLDLQLEAEEQKAHELVQMKDALIRTKMMRSNAEHSTNLTEAISTGPAMLPSVQTGNTPSTPVMSQTGQLVSLPDPAAPGPFTTLVEKPKKLPKKNPDSRVGQSLVDIMNGLVMGSVQASRVSWSHRRTGRGG